jgi:hypothetical protein
MEIELFPEAEEDMDGMDNPQRKVYIKHFEKISLMPQGRHLKFGLPYNVEEVGQGRIVYQVKNDTIYIIRCFSTHKDYEKWLRSF